MSNVLIGTAIGDALGVFAESKLPNYQPLLDWDGKTFLGSEHHGLKPGQFSDDTQLSIEIAESLVVNSGFNPDDLSKRYVDWIVSGRARGYGRTTLMAIQNLIAGKHWSESGIAGSYGNGTAMRSAPFGVYFRNDLQSLIAICKIDSAITHASEDAEAGSIAIALAAAYAINNDTENLLERISEKLPNSKVKGLVYSLGALVNSDKITPQQALRVLGTKANVRESVPAALYCFLKFDNYNEACITIIKNGGDTDTNSAMLGALYGAKNGLNHFSEHHVKNVEDTDKIIILDSQLFNRSNVSYFSR